LENEIELKLISLFYVSLPLSKWFDEVWTFSPISLVFC